MILEGIVTTLNEDGSLNVSPMGPEPDDEFTSLLLRPFAISHTCANLRRSGVGVFHVTDDVLLLAQAAVGNPVVDTFPANAVEGAVLSSTCRYYEFRVLEIDDSADRVRMKAEVILAGRIRDFWGLNRAKHAVVEAAILASRINFLPRNEILESLECLRPLVHKTGGSREQQAFSFLEQFIRSADDGVA